MSSIIIRADANSNIGMGHVMRCLSIADAAIAAGHTVRWILADESVLKLINSRGYEAYVLGSDYCDMMSELVCWNDVYHADSIIVDSYFVTEEYFCAIRSYTDRLVYIDDIGAKAYPVDVLVNYNIYGPDIDYEGLYSAAGIKLPRMVLGVCYAPLRAMFMNVLPRTQNEIVRDVIISTGGADELHIALNMVRKIKKRDRDDVRFYLLIGTLNRDRDDIYKEADGEEHITLYEGVEDMREFIASADLVVSAAGSTLYEVCACGVPLVTFVSADNQLLGAEAFAKCGLAVNVGDIRESDSIDHNKVISGELADDACDRILKAVKELSLDYLKRSDMGRKMQEMIDGRGAERSIKTILNQE